MFSTRVQAKIDQKEYLKKYLYGDKTKKKKKKKSSDKKSATVKIIDDDAQAPAFDDEDDLIFLTGEDAPQIAGEFVEDTPAQEKQKKWRKLGEDGIKRENDDDDDDNGDAWGSKVKKEKIKDEFSPVQRKIKAERCSDDDLSPKRIRKTEKQSRVKRENSPDNDLSPPRFSRQEKSSRSINDVPSNSRKNPRRSFSRDRSPPRRSRWNKSNDESPERRPSQRNRSVDQSPVRRHRSRTPEVQRRKIKQENSRKNDQRSPSMDQSPPRRSRRSNSKDQSPPRRPSQRNRSVDQSPVRKQRRSRTPEGQRRQIHSRKNNNRSPSMDQTPPRRQRRSNSRSPTRRRRQSPSPENRRRKEYQNNRRNRSRSRESPMRSRDFRKTSPGAWKHDKYRSRSPDRRFNNSGRSPMREDRRMGRKSDSPPPTHAARASKTLDGKKAGLQDAAALKAENEERRRAEDRMYEKMSSSVSGRDADVQVRASGRRGKRFKEADEDPEVRRQKEERERMKKEQYDRWGKGLKQVEDYRERMEQNEYESSKPLARYANDEDLDRHLREQERTDDPMLEYMRRKRKENEKKSNKPSRPIYEGTYPENRFGIRPGYRWDGVDRSNGYEQKWFNIQNERRALQEDAYKYSVEDM